MTAVIDEEAIAAQIHEYYVQAANAKNRTVDFKNSYATLPEHMKADNRAAARRIGQVLALAGLKLAPNGGKPWSEEDRAEIRKLIEQNLDLLAEGEHDGWTRARLRENWKPGKCKNAEARESHLLVPWDRFPEVIKIKQEAAGPIEKEDKTPMTLDEEVEAEKEKDRNSVRSYVAIIAGTDYRIVGEGR